MELVHSKSLYSGANYCLVRLVFLLNLRGQPLPYSLVMWPSYFWPRLCQPYRPSCVWACTYEMRAAHLFTKNISRFMRIFNISCFYPLKMNLKHFSGFDEMYSKLNSTNNNLCCSKVMNFFKYSSRNQNLKWIKKKLHCKFWNYTVISNLCLASVCFWWHFSVSCDHTIF